MPADAACVPTEPSRTVARTSARAARGREKGDHMTASWLTRQALYRRTGAAVVGALTGSGGRQIPSGTDVVPMLSIQVSAVPAVPVPVVRSLQLRDPGNE